MCREITESSKNNYGRNSSDFNFPHIDWESHSTKGLDGMESPENFGKQSLEGPTWKVTTLHLYGNNVGQVTKTSDGELILINDQDSMEVVMEKIEPAHELKSQTGEDKFWKY